MEGAAQQRQVAQVVGRLAQALQRLVGALDHLAGFVDEDLAHLVVFFQPGAALHFRLRRRRGARRLLCSSRLGRGRPGQVGHGLGQFAAHRLALLVVGGALQRLLRRGHGFGQRALVGQQGLLRQAAQFLLHRLVGHVGLGRSQRQRLSLVHQRRGCARLELVEAAEGRQPVRAPAHHRAQIAGVGVVTEQRARHLRLHTEHVDHEAQRAQVVGKPREGAGLDSLFGIDIRRRQCVDILAHAQDGLRGLVHVQYREHATHGLQLARHRNQHFALCRVAEVQVDLLFHLRQRGAQFLHDTAHGLAVRHAPVQLLHPRLERLGVAAFADLAYALCQALHPLADERVVEATVLQRGVQVHDAGGHFHRQRGSGRLSRRKSLVGGCLQGLGQHLARRIQPLQGIADQRKLLGQTALAVGLSASHCRPHFLGAGHALACLSDPGRVEAAQAKGLVVEGRSGIDFVGFTHGFEPRRLTRVARRACMRAEEQHVLGQAVGDLGLAGHAQAQLREQPRADTLGVDVSLQQAGGLRFIERGRKLPELGQAPVRRGAKARTQVAQPLHRRAVGAAHDGEHLGFHGRARRCVGLDGHRLGIRTQFPPLPVVTPQIGRMHPVGTGPFLQGTVLREQRQRRQALAGKLAAQIVEHAERGRFDGFDRGAGQQLGPGDEALHRVFAGAQHTRRARQPDHLQCAQALVQLRPSGAQHRRVDRIDIRARDRLGLLEVAAQRLVRRLQGAAQLVVHPGQGAEVVDRVGLLGHLVQHVHRRAALS